ncbi:hypothetical protein Adt_35074 [Abeliophyllum distichum]|uniref:Uncharacterized protein n=1 Tax=Abeliophyllum distichum TaxID=126358 RepID=A0ABD1QFI1_9LAMI
MSITLLLGPSSWDSALQQLGPSLTSKEHRLTASHSYPGLGQTAAWLLPYRQGESPCDLALPPGASLHCFALPPGTRPSYSLAPSLCPKCIASLLGPPTWDSAKLQLGSSLTSKEHRLAAWPSHLGLDQTAAWLLTYLQGASSRCLALPPGTQPYSWILPYFQGASPRCLALPPRTQPTAAWLLPYLQKASPRCLAHPPSTRPNCCLAPPLPPRSIALRLAPTTWDWDKLQLGSSLTSKEHRLAAWPSYLGLGHTAAWLLPYLQGASPHYFPLLPGTRPNYSLAPSLRPRSMASLLGPPTWDSVKLQLCSFLFSKKHRLVA